MNSTSEHTASKTVDSIQQRLTRYVCKLNYNDLPIEVIHASKGLIIDTLGSLIGGFFGETCCVARNLAAQIPNPVGATVIGTRMKTTPDLAAFVNGTTSRYVEMNDVYHSGYHGHPSEVITPLLGVAEHAQANGRDYITSVVLGYEIYLRICDVFHNPGFDNTIFGCVGTAASAGKLLGLSPSQISHCISMAVVSNNPLKQVRLGHLSMYKGAACGEAARGGVFAALLARAGMEGPHLPFEGKAGWCEHVACERFSLDTWGGDGTPFKILNTLVKIRAAESIAIASILAAEKIGRQKNVKEVKQVTVEVLKYGMELMGEGKHPWNPDSRETADHSIPYVVAATLMDGTITSRSYNDAHLWSPELRAFMRKIEVVENEEFTKAYNQVPQQHRSRVTVITSGGERLVGESGGDRDDIGAAKSDKQIEEKFRGLTEEVLGAKRVTKILERLWHLEEVSNVVEIPAAFVID